MSMEKDIEYIRARVDHNADQLSALSAMFEGHINTQGHEETVNRLGSLERTRSWAKGVMAVLALLWGAGLGVLLQRI